MNTLIETLNHWGETFLNFAWPMLWQSSLLIVVVFVLDCLLARRVRAAIRHALWMVVLVKLLLPPALALPTGAAWWLWPAKPPLMPLINTETVTFDTAPLPDNFVPQSTPIALPPPKLNGLGWAMLASGVISAGLLLSLLMNWLKVARKTHRASTFASASGDFTDPLNQALQLAGLRRPMRLKLVDDAISPAVYGLFRPVILLPRALAEKLSTAQLRAVLLHEAVHLRRGDVWVNCAQTLLQIAYWWHPLLWLANARIRRLREEAVDDAVMVALRGDADAYAPTLLEVAKFAFRRPLASLGLVGILESRSALRQRVERLVDFRPPRRAGVTFLSLLAIFVFGAVALPMGQAPAMTAESGPIDRQLPVATVPFSSTNVLIQGSFFWMPSADAETLVSGLQYHEGQDENAPDWTANPAQFDAVNNRIHSLKLKPFQRPRIEIDGCRQGAEGDLYSGTRTNWVRLDCAPVVAGGRIELDMKAVVGRVSPLDETNLIEIHGNETVENHGGMIFRVPDPNDASSYLVLVIGVKTTDAAPASLQVETNMMMRVAATDAGPTFEVEHYLILGNSLLTPQTIDSTLANIDGAFGTNVSFEGVRTVVEQLQQAYHERGYDTVEVTLPRQKLTNATVKVQVREGRLSAPGLHHDIFINAPVRQVETNTIVTTSAGREDIYRKLNRIHLDTVSYQDLPLSEVLRVLREESLLRDPDKTGINFLFNPNIESTPAPAINPATGLPVQQQAQAQPADPTQINITLKLTNVSLANLLDAICLISDHPIKYSIEDYGIVFSPKGPDTAHYEMRTFKVDADKLLSSLKERLPSSVSTMPDPQTGEFSLIVPLAKEFFWEQGVNLEPPKTIFFNDRLGAFFVYATPQDLDAIERLLATMNVGTAQTTKQAEAAALAKDGQMCYEMGKLEEATKDFSWALALDPDNQGARYYLNLILQAQGFRQPQSGAVYPIVHSTQVPYALARPGMDSDEYTKAKAYFDTLMAPASYQSVSAPINPANLITNYFRINMAAFNAAVLKETGESDALLGFKDLAAARGVDFLPPEYVAIMSERFGIFYVVATRKDMGIIAGLLDKLHGTPQQIHIKARFIEVPKTFFDNARNSIPSSVTNGGILTHAQFLKFLHQLQSQKGSQELAEPEVTTISGRQTQMRATVIHDVVTNFIFEAESPTQRVATVSPQMTKVETGPILDTLASVWPDGYTIDLTAIPSLIKFYGYADTKGLTPHFGTNSDGEKIELPTAIPVFAVGEVTEQKALYDGQTLVLLPKPEIKYNGGAEEQYRDRIIQHIQEAQKKDGDADKQLVVLVTVTLIDAVGNRVHTEADMPFAANSVPPPWP